MPPLLRAGRPGAHSPWRPEARLLVVSPHCDDAVLSLGATLAGHVRGGGEVTVLTVLAGDPAGVHLPGPWDTASGATTQAGATAARRGEDLRACAVLGARAVHLDDVDEQYPPVQPAGALADQVAAQLPGHDVVLLPGRPLRHADHRRVLDLVLPLVPPAVPVHLYLEQPYSVWAGDDAGPARHPSPSWSARPPSRSDLLRKARAVAAYRSQLAPLGSASGGAARLLGQLLRAALEPGELVSAALTSRAHRSSAT